MLHILLLILKIIGIIIAAILGILVLFLCIVLFVPVRYEIQGKCDGTVESLKGKLKVTWLLHLIRLDLLYKDKAARWKVRIAWKKITGGMKSAESTGNTEVTKPGGENAVKETVDVPEKGECQDEQKKETINMAEEVEKPQTETKAHPGISEKLQKTEKTDKKSKKITISEKIAAFFRKIKCTFQKFCDKIKLVSEKKDKVTAFLQDEQHKKAFSQVKKGAFRLLHRWKPKKINGTVLYGFEDPYHTGKALAGLAMVYPFIGEHVEIIPDFEHKVLKGKLYIKGHIRASHLAALAVRLILSKAVRTTYKDIRNFKL